jgi:hypothetical protein
MANGVVSDDFQVFQEGWQTTTTTFRSLNDKIPEISQRVNEMFPNVNIVESNNNIQSIQPTMKTFTTPLMKILSITVIRDVRQPERTPQLHDEQSNSTGEKSEHMTPVQRITNEIIEFTLEIAMRNFNRGGHH